MKKTILLLSISLLALAFVGQNKKLPAINLKSLDGKTVDLSKIENNGKPIVISFWATWCKPCKTELNTISKEYASWQKETGVKLIAVSIDNARSNSRVAPYVKTEGWEYTILMDPNGELKKAMNVKNVPHTFLIDGKGNIVWDHNNYVEGDEKKLLEEIKKHAK